MLKRYHNIVGGTFRFLDALIIGSVWLASYWIRFYIPFFAVTKGLPSFSTYAALLPVVIGLWLIVFSMLGLYKPKKMLRRTQEAHLVLRAHGIAVLVFIALTYLFSEYRYSRLVMIYFSGLGVVLLVFARVIFRNILRSLRKKGFKIRKIVVIGDGPSIEILIQRLERFPELGLSVVGVITRSGEENSGYSKAVLGKYSNVKAICENIAPDEVLIALPRSDSFEVDSILNGISDVITDIRIIPDVFDYITLGCEVEDFDGFPVVNLNDSPLDGWGAITKRITDIILSLFGLTILSPFLVIIAGLIKITSRGPVIYRQERMGLDGKTFQMLKFRSMKIDAETKSGAVWAQENDDRRTLIGSTLRMTSLDELPQLLNVFKGEMSLVGPRPERPVFVKKFKTEIPNYMLRHKVKAGLTGWAQINGWRGNTSLDRRIEFDLYYIRNWSYLLDIKIIVMTLWKGFINKNAY